jgi:hypothetical protein
MTTDQLRQVIKEAADLLASGVPAAAEHCLREALKNSAQPLSLVSDDYPISEYEYTETRDGQEPSTTERQSWK